MNNLSEYDELVKELRNCVDSLCGECKYQHLQKPGNFVPCMNAMITEAADAIEELSKQHEAQRQNLIALMNDKPRWIPVTERLPKEGEFALVYGDLYPNKHDGGVIAVSKRMDWNYWQGFGRERDITHWMSLPPAPKEEAE